ncbi:Hypothetical protein SCLAV_p0922 (plasmid) [Streptomyces clavuligerus]|uniref:Uncharacterized protein n=1 Tax=Streptomyces clavuligerus TaxID=1901 RepID=D5SKG6_STRCL|nr:Hypothetical protein SCLAV_p0922 [Streptomyces clavuligerus]
MRGERPEGHTAPRGVGDWHRQPRRRARMTTPVGTRSSRMGPTPVGRTRCGVRGHLPRAEHWKGDTGPLPPGARLLTEDCAVRDAFGIPRSFGPDAEVGSTGEAVFPDASTGAADSMSTPSGRRCRRGVPSCAPRADPSLSGHRSADQSVMRGPSGLPRWATARRRRVLRRAVATEPFVTHGLHLLAWMRSPTR